MNYKGVVIEESLSKTLVLRKMSVVKTRTEQVTLKHKTPWLKKWTLHTVEVAENLIEDVVKTLSKTLDKKHASSWYADFKNDKYHYIVFREKIFNVDLNNPLLYKKAKKYGLSLGIPDYQMQFERLKR